MKKVGVVVLWVVGTALLSAAAFKAGQALQRPAPIEMVDLKTGERRVIAD